MKSMAIAALMLLVLPFDAQAQDRERHGGVPGGAPGAPPSGHGGGQGNHSGNPSGAQGNRGGDRSGGPAMRPAHPEQARPQPAMEARPRPEVRPEIRPGNDDHRDRPGAGARPERPDVRPDRPNIQPGRPSRPSRPDVRPSPVRPGAGQNRPPTGNYWTNNHWNQRPVVRPGFSYPRGYRYRRWSPGLILPSLFLGSGFFFDDYQSFYLDSPPYGYRWVRYGPDLLLVNIRTGRIRDVRYGVFE